MITRQSCNRVINARLPTLQQVRDAIGRGRFPKNTLRLIQQTHKRWRGAIEAGRNGACDIRSWMRYLAMRNVRWNQRLPSSFDLAEWYGSALAFAEAGLTEEFLAVREAAAIALPAVVGISTSAEARSFKRGER